MYGGTGRGGLLALAMTLSLLGVTGCEQDGSATRRPAASASESPAATGDPVSTVDVAAAYETWAPSYTDVRPATADDIEAIRQRVVDRNANPYTAAVPLMGFEIASAPAHVRVRFGEGPGGFDLHLDPTTTSKSFFGEFILCSADDDSCVAVGEDGPSNDGPHLFNNGIDTLVFLASSIVGAQFELPDMLAVAGQDASVATVDSPAGVLDCVLTGSTPPRRERLQGKHVNLMVNPFTRVGGPDPLSTVCVDERGLVVVSLPSLMSGVVAYGAFVTGVPDDFDDHPAPAPYGEEPPATPTTQPTSTPGTGSDEVREVLMAAGPIRAGESLADVQASAMLVLEAVPGNELAPGAVSSTSGLDGVALRDIAEGAQITDDSFG